MRIIVLVVVMVAGLSSAAQAERDYPWCVFGGGLRRSRRVHVFDARTVPGLVIRALEHLLRCESAREIPAAGSGSAPDARNGAIADTGKDDLHGLARHTPDNRPAMSTSDICQIARSLTPCAPLMPGM